jgi:hemoglobin/transferrin/lactoferrin receptor protein
MARAAGRIRGGRAGRIASLAVLWPVLLTPIADAGPVVEPAPPTSTAASPVQVAAVSADSAAAKPAPGERALMLATTVVTATRHESDTLKAPVAITVVGPERIERSVNPSVADLLREVPGVFVVDNTIAGMQRLRIRGEDARRGMVLLDGQEISDHSSFGPGLLIDPSFIERIEVVRGPHSTLYGSRAAGGVINVITRKRPEREVEATLASGYSGATDGWRADGMFAVRKGGAWMRASGAGMDNNDRDTPEGPLDDTSNDAESALIQAGWSDDTHDLRMLYDFYDLSSRAATPDSLVDGSVISKYHMDMPQRDRDRVAAFYDGKNLLPGLERVHLDAYWQQVDRRLTQDIAGLVLPPSPPPTRYDYANDDRDTIDTWGLNAQADWKPHRDHLLTTGLTWIDDTLDKVVDRTGTLTKGPLVTPVDESLQTDAGIWTTALFAQDTWSFLEDWQLTAGVRWYHVHSVLDDSNDPLLVPGSESDDAAVGSASLVWNPLKPLALRASWGQGYVYPTLLQLHTGSLFGQGNITRPNPNLDPETSNNWELGARWQDSRYALDTAVFYTLSDDYIAAVSAADAPEAGWPAYERTYTNLDSAETWGVEAAGRALLGRTGAEAYGVLTYLRRELEFATFKTAKSGLPELSGRVGLRYEHELPFGSNGYVDLWVAAGGESEEKTSRSTTSTGGWSTVNVSMGIEHEHGWLGIELLNIADESYRPTTQELVQPGCHMNVGARIEF